MSKTGMPVVEPETGVAPAEIQERADESQFAADVEQWLRREVKPEAPVLWRPRGSGGQPVRGADDLAERVSTLAEEGEWAVVSRAHGATWGQCMRVERGWIVEVNGIPGPDCYVRRVRRGGRGLPGTRRRVHSNGHLMAIYESRDVMATPASVADIMWSWLRGALPEGYVLCEIPT